MTVYHYCTPEWLEESYRIYQINTDLQEKLKKVSYNMCYRVLADPDWGLDQDIIFGAFFNQGQLTRMAFFTEEDAKKDADFILAATPQEWIKLLRKQYKFIARFMMNEIKLDQGDKVDVLKLAPYSRELVEALTQVDMKYADEMSPEELEKYRAHIISFRSELGV